MNYAGRTRCPEGWSLTPERTLAWTDLDAWYLVDGFGRVASDFGEIGIRPGDILLLRGGHPYTFHRDSDVPFVHYWAHFDILDSNRRPIHVDRVAPLPFHTRMTDLELVATLWERLLKACRRTGGAGDSSVWMAAILAETTAVSSGSADEPDQDGRVAQCCRAIDDDPGGSWSIETLARETGLSRSQFYRLFRESSGLAPQQYIVEARMRLARTLLRESTLPIGDIAGTVGYEDPRFFSRHFRQHNGRSPREYRLAP